MFCFFSVSNPFAYFLSEFNIWNVFDVIECENLQFTSSLLRLSQLNRSTGRRRIWIQCWFCESSVHVSVVRFFWAQSRLTSFHYVRLAFNLLQIWMNCIPAYAYYCRILFPLSCVTANSSICRLCVCFTPGRSTLFFRLQYVKMNLCSVCCRATIRRYSVHISLFTAQRLATYEMNGFRICMNVRKRLMRELKIEYFHDSLRFNSVFYCIMWNCDANRMKEGKKYRMCRRHWQQCKVKMIEMKRRQDTQSRTHTHTNSRTHSCSFGNDNKVQPKNKEIIFFPERCYTTGHRQ